MHQLPGDLAANTLQLSTWKEQYIHLSHKKFALFQPARDGVNAISGATNLT